MEKYGKIMLLIRKITKFSNIIIVYIIFLIKVVILAKKWSSILHYTLKTWTAENVFSFRCEKKQFEFESGVISLSFECGYTFSTVWVFNV